MSLPHLVVPGQVIAVSTNNEDSFLCGHGTYQEETPQGLALRASLTGVVTRVNKFISVASSLETTHVGDLVVGRITAVGATQWKVDLGTRTARLPLSGVHLPGGVQRVRTSADARAMHTFLQVGDLRRAFLEFLSEFDKFGIQTNGG